MFALSGEDLVSEQEDEAETGGAGLPRPSSPTGDVPGFAPGSVPRHGWTATPLLPGRPGLLPAPRPAAGPPAAADAPSPPPACHDPQHTLLLKNSKTTIQTFPTETLIICEQVQSRVVLFDV